MSRRCSCVVDGSCRELTEVIRGADGRVDGGMSGPRRPQGPYSCFFAKRLQL